MKVMPNNLEAEQSLLGSIILYERSVRIVIESGLDSDDFFLDAHRKIFHAIILINDERKPIDITTLHAKLQDLNLLDVVGGLDYLIELQEASVTSANTKNYVEIIQNKAHARRLIEVANEVAEDGFDGSIAVEDLLDSAEKRILEVTRTRKTDDFKSGKEVVQSVVENIYRMRDNKTSITGVKTGYRSLDRLTNGLQRGDLIILAARPSVGKTAFALNLALKTAKYNDQAVAIFSLEMPAEHLISRMLAVESGVPGNTLKTGKFANDDELNRTNSAASSLSGLKIYIDDSSMIKTSEVFSKCRRLQAEHGLALIVIDYIQLISGSAKSKENRQQEVSEISRNLKALARELNVPVVALSQLSRGVESRTDKKPMLSDLRESGSIEQDADIVMMLYRSEYYENRGQEENSQEVEVIVGKHRNGATGILKMFFTKDVNTFTDMDNNFN